MAYNYITIERETARKWDAIDSYDLILDSGSMGIDSCIQILESLL